MSVAAAARARLLGRLLGGRARALAWLLAAWLGGCASAPPPAPGPGLFDDAAFGPPSVPVDRAAVFALNDGMRRFIDEDIARQARALGPQRALVDALGRSGPLRLEYDAKTTRNAAQAFDARAGNCLSLVLMTAALAKALDLRVDFNSAYLDETWSRRGDLLVISGHVNVSFGRRAIHAGVVRYEPPVTIDFLPPDELHGLRTRPIDESTVVAMYFNNRAAESLIAQQLDDAYAFARAAVHADPGFLSAYNTLGLIYRRHAQEALAVRVFEHVIAIDAGHRQAIANLADALDALGRGSEAAHWRQALARIEPFAPFHFVATGRAAAARGDWAEARRQFERELARNAYSSEVHHWIALASWHLGDAVAARKHLALAADNSTSGSERALYSAKLAWISRTRQQ